MNYRRTRKFDKMYARLKDAQKAQFQKQLALLLENQHHPSLHMKFFGDTWHARVSVAYRFTFDIDGDTYVLNTIGPHPK